MKREQYSKVILTIIFVLNVQTKLKKFNFMILFNLFHFKNLIYQISLPLSPDNSLFQVSHPQSS